MANEMQSGYYMPHVSSTVSTERRWAEIGTQWNAKGGALALTNVGTPAVAALNTDRIAVTYSSSQILATYDFDHQTHAWVLVGNELFVGGNRPAIARLLPTRIAYVDSTGDELRTYDFDGTDWAQVGNSLALGPSGDPTMCSLGATRIAFLDSSTDELRTYDFDGTDWAQVGNALPIAMVGTPAVATLDANRIVLTEGFRTTELFRVFDFDGTDWVQVGAAPTNFGMDFVGSFPSLTSPVPNQFLFYDSFNRQLRKFGFDGTLWGEIGTGTLVAAAGTGEVAITALAAYDVALLGGDSDELQTYSNTFATFEGDFEVSFYVPREDTPINTHARVLAGSDSRIALYNSDAPLLASSGPNAIVVAGTAQTTVFFDALEGIAQGDFVKIDVIRAGTSLSVKINGITVETIAASPLTFEFSEIGVGVTSNLNTIVANMRITNVETGKAWYFQNLNDPGAALVDAGAFGENGVWIQGGPPMLDAPADAARVLVSFASELFKRTYQHMLPRARAWTLKFAKKLADFFCGLSELPDRARQFYDDIYLDLFPATTQQLDEWETQFNLVSYTPADLMEQSRRTRLAAAWAARGGQSPSYLQGVLRGLGFDVYVHEWWDPDAFAGVRATSEPTAVSMVSVFAGLAPLGENRVMVASFGELKEYELVAGVYQLRNFSEPVNLAGSPPAAAATTLYGSGDFALALLGKVDVYRRSGTGWTLLDSLAVATLQNASIALFDEGAGWFAVIDGATQALRTLVWNGTTLTQEGNALALGVGAEPEVARLNAARVAVFDSGTDNLQTYEWDGADWSVVGAAFDVVPHFMGTLASRTGMAGNVENRIVFANSGANGARVFAWNDGAETWSAPGLETPISLIGAQVAPLSESAVLMSSVNAVNIQVFETVADRSGGTVEIPWTLRENLTPVTQGLISTGIALGALSETQFAATYNNNLYAYDFSIADDTITQAGNALAVVNSADIAGLDGDSIAQVDNSVNGVLKKFDFDGTDWAQVGNALNTEDASDGAVVGALDASTVAVYYHASGNLKAFDFDGTDWAQVGNTLSLPATVGGVRASGLAVLTSGLIALVRVEVGTGVLITAYAWDGTDFTQEGLQLNSTAEEHNVLRATALDSDRIVARRTQDVEDTEIYKFIGGAWILQSTAGTGKDEGADIVASSASQVIAIDPAAENELLGYEVTNRDVTPTLRDPNDAVAAGGDVVVNVPGLFPAVVPADRSKWPYFVYIGGEEWPDAAAVPSARQQELRDTCLKYFPTEQWLIINTTP